jgi:uncharacterized membrane protein
MSDDRTQSLLHLVAVVLLGLLAGLFFAFSVAVMPGLGDAGDRTLVEAMQEINRAIENPAFFLVFFATPIVLGFAIHRARRSGDREVARLLIAALVLYALVLVCTFAVNIPLNEDLKDAGDPASIKDLAKVKSDFYDGWVVANIFRTLASTAALACAAWGLSLRSRGGVGAPQE